MESVEFKIEKRVKSRGRGKIYFASDFAGFGSSKAVNKALERLALSGTLIRFARGIYLFPQIDALLGLGILYPSIEEVAREIAQRDKARIVPTGDYALHALGLSTQIPMNAVFLTDGASRKITIGNGKGIVFKRTVPRNLSFKSERLMLIATALKEIGNGKVTIEQKEKIRTILLQENKKLVLADLHLLPAWIRKIITSVYESTLDETVR